MSASRRLTKIESPTSAVHPELCQESRNHIFAKTVPSSFAHIFDTRKVVSDSSKLLQMITSGCLKGPRNNEGGTISAEVRNIIKQLCKQPDLCLKPCQEGCRINVRKIPARLSTALNKCSINGTLTLQLLGILLRQIFSLLTSLLGLLSRILNLLQLLILPLYISVRAILRFSSTYASFNKSLFLAIVASSDSTCFFSSSLLASKSTFVFSSTNTYSCNLISTCP